MTISPYLMRPLRSLKQAQRERDAAPETLGVAPADVAHQAALLDDGDAAHFKGVKGCEPASICNYGMAESFDSTVCRWCGAEGESREDVSAECEDSQCPFR